ncbi:MAG: ABC transporter permease [Candidatus Acidiferrales bacterium]
MPNMLHALAQDLRYGIRMLARNPGFALVAILTLALGIGANAAVFSVINTVLLRPLPLPDSRQLAVVFRKNVHAERSWAVAYPDLQDWQRQSQVFEAISAFAPGSVNLTGREEPTRVRGGFVSANFFRVVGVQPSLGRGFQPGEDESGAARVIVINYSLWQGLLGGDPQVLGKPLTLNGQVFTIVGVMPQSFRFPIDYVDTWIPAINDPHFSLQRSVESTGAIGRIKPGATRTRAQAEMDTITHRLAQQFPDTDGLRGAEVVPVQDVVTEDIRPAVLVLSAAVAFVLLIACANVASLFLARASGRHREMALRATLGAGPGRLIRQIVTETLLLWFAGALFGLVVGRLALDGLARIRPSDSWAQFPRELDFPVLAFTLGITIFTGLIFGLIPALRFSSSNLVGALKEGNRAAGRSVAARSTGRWLVVSQVALALVLLLGAGLTMKSLSRLTGVNPGFNPNNLLTLEYRLPRSKYPQKSQQLNFHRQVVERANALPGVLSAAEVLGLPISGNGGDTAVVFTDRPAPSPAETPRAQINACEPHYFRTMEIPLLRGRQFTSEDTPDSPRVAVVNQAMVNKFWNGADPIGKSIRLPEENNVTATIVGVVGDVKQYNLDDATIAQIYVPQTQSPNLFATLIARFQGDPMTQSSALRSAVWAVDKDQPVWKIRTEQSLLDISVGPQRFLMLMMEVFSALSLMLAAIGIYGVISYSTSQRIQEIGVRVALGAQKRDIFRLVLGEGLWIAACGLGIGFVGALGLTRFLTSQLYGVSATDPATFASVAILLAAIALLACYVPARRAMRVDPMVALHYE